MSPSHRLSDINALPSEEFVRLIGPVFEHSPWIAERTCAKRPFGSVQAIYEALCQTVRQAAPQEQVNLIQAHPDLVGRAALAGTLTPASNSEQASAGLNRLTQEEITTFQDFNQSYRERFGFPFVICARLNKKEAILNAFPTRLRHSREEEVRAALDEIYKIAYLRLKDIVAE